MGQKQRQWEGKWQAQWQAKWEGKWEGKCQGRQRQVFHAVQRPMRRKRRKLCDNMRIALYIEIVKNHRVGWRRAGPWTQLGEGRKRERERKIIRAVQTEASALTSSKAKKPQRISDMLLSCFSITNYIQYTTPPSPLSHSLLTSPCI